MNRFQLAHLGLLTALLLPSSLPAETGQAEPPKWYDVELLIYTRDRVADMESEQWPEEQPLLLDEALPIDLATLPLTTDETSLPTTELEMLRLDDGQLRLSEQASKIDSSSQLSLLLHTGWRQAGVERERAPQVRIYAKPAKPFAGAEAAPVEADLFALAEPSVELEGVIRVSLARYLHLDSQLLYRLPLAPTQATESEVAIPLTDAVNHAEGSPESLFSDGTAIESGTPIYGESMMVEPVPPAPTHRSFLLAEKRRMRSRQLHYLDHPLFGVVVAITPVAVKVPAEPAKP